MKRLVLSSLLALGLPALGVLAEPAPITVTVKSYEALSSGMRQVFDAVMPGAADSTLDELGQALGLTSLEGVDRNRPWQVGVWLAGMGARPNISFRVPVSDFEAFRTAYNAGSGNTTARKVTQAGKYANIWIENGPVNETEKNGHAQWSAADLGPVNDILSMQIAPSETLRAELLQTLGMGRNAMMSALSQQQGQAVPGMDPKAMIEIMGLYLDVFDVGVRGLKSFQIGFDVSDAALIIKERVTPKNGSDLAAWLQGSPGTLDSVLPFLKGDAPAAFALRVPKAPAYLPMVKKLMGLSMQLQGLEADSPAVRETQEMIESMLPMKFAGVVAVDEGFSFAGLYQFPGRDVKEVYGVTKRFLKQVMPEQAGEDKPYKEITFKEGVRTVNGVSVDRAVMEFNMEAPIYQMPGQRDMIESLWPDAKMEFDYAIRGENMYTATPSLLDDVLADNTPGAISFKGIKEDTVAAGRVNLVKVVSSFLSANPMVPNEAKQMLQQLDPQGTDIQFRVDLNGALASEAKIPLQLFKAIGQVVAGQ